MAEQPKKKIDLKARLGKTTQVGLQPPTPLPIPGGAGPTPAPPSSDPGASPSSAPSAPSSAPSSAGARATGAPTPIPIPAPIASVPGLSPGIPIPPFAQPQRQAPAPQPKPTAAQQTIKVEVGEEIELERKKGRSRVAMGAVAGAVIGALIGFVGGGSKSTGDRARAAARGAGLLEKDVKGTIDKLKDLDEKLTAAGDKLKSKSYPEDLSTALAGLKVPFDSTNLDGKDVGSLPPRVLKNVLNFTSAVEALDKSRESLKNIVGIAKDPITKAWKEEKEPVANFSVVFRSEGGKPVAELVPNKEPFAWKPDGFPDKIKVTRLEGQRAAEKTASRYVKGDVTAGSDLNAIPVDPKSVAAFTSEQLVSKLIKGVYDMRTDLEGNKDNPTNETPGLVKMAEDLVNELHKASLNQ